MTQGRATEIDDPASESKAVNTSKRRRTGRAKAKTGCYTCRFVWNDIGNSREHLQLIISPTENAASNATRQNPTASAA
jgi:hypothetical protein